MLADDLLQRVGKPAYELAFHVSSALPAGAVDVIGGSPFAGADTVDIYVQGIAALGALPHAGGYLF